MDGCPYSTVVKRARPTHLLREHRLLFRGRGLSPTPLSDAEFNERIEALRRRNRGGRQRAREAGRACRMDAADGDGGWADPAPADVPVAGSPAILVVLEDEDWGTAVVDLELLLEEDLGVEGPPPEQPPANEEHHTDWVVVPWVPPSTEESDIPYLPRGVSTVDFVNQISTLRSTGLGLLDTIDAAANFWAVPPDELPMLRLAVHLVAAARQVEVFDTLELAQRELLHGRSMVDVANTVIDSAIITAAQH